jgi:glucokinase
MEIIAGDIGGTKSWLVWVEGEDYASQRLRFEHVYASADFSDMGALLKRFIHDAGVANAPDSLTLALPGVVLQKQARLTNLDWLLDADALAAELSIPAVQFLNDFQAAAVAVETLTAADTIVLNAGRPQPGGVRAITGAGTGLGLAWMQADARGDYQPFASEGGHADFAPANAEQDALLAFVRNELDGASPHVSWERVVSGSALTTLYRFCAQQAGHRPDATVVDGARIDQLAASGGAVAIATLDLFVELYGAWVGNVALLYQPNGGLYIAGGVAIHLQQRMRSPRFMAACRDKGRMRNVAERTPIHLITNKRLGAQGAIAFSYRQAALNRSQAEPS